MSSSAPESSSESDPPLRAQAAAWIVRRERGLTPQQEREFKAWLAADPRHRAALAEASRVWSALDAIPAGIGQPIVERSRRGARWRGPACAGLAAAAAIAFLAWSGWTDRATRRTAEQRPAITGASDPAAPQTQALGDGTRVRLNVGAEIAEEFSAAERRVRLVRGEAYFLVTRDPARPFIVQAGAVTVRAVGTAFNVRWQARAVDILVTEGRVVVNPPAPARRPDGATPDGEPLVVAGQRAVVELSAVDQPSSVVISPVTQADMVAALAWHEPLRKLGGVTLVEFAADFERQTGRRMVVTDLELRELRIGGRFRSEDLDELLRILAENYGIASERAADGTVVLRKGR